MPPPPKLEPKKELLTELCHFFVIDKARSTLKQFKEGLRTLDVEFSKGITHSILSTSATCRKL